MKKLSFRKQPLKHGMAIRMCPSRRQSQLAKLLCPSRRPDLRADDSYDPMSQEKLPTKLPIYNFVVEPKQPSWSPDDAFEAKPMTQPLDNPLASMLLTKPPDEFPCHTASPSCTLIGDPSS